MNSSKKNEACTQITEAARLIENASVDVISLLKKIENIINSMTQNDETTQIREILSSAYETFTFEDIASQHLNKAIDIIKCQETGNPLLAGPAIKGEKSLSQKDVDDLLNS